MNIPPALSYPAIVSAGVPQEAARRIVDAVERILSPPSGPSVRVRIAVAVNQRGYWSADGGRGAGDAKLRQNVREFVKGFAAFHWVEADVPLPLAPRTIRGEVTVPAEEQ